MHKRLWLMAALAVLGAGSLVWATTHHTITVNGNLGDFAADEKLPADSAIDSLFGANNELTSLYVTWDAQNLYLGYDFSAWGTAVMLLVDVETSVGATSFCSTAGYMGAFPANFITGAGGNIDLMLGMYVPDVAPPSPPLKAYAYQVTHKGSNDITASLPSPIAVTYQSNASAQKHTGAVEAAIPWNQIYGLGPGKVSSCAKLKLALVLRGKSDGSALGDSAPDATLGDKSHDCWTASSKISTIDKFHTVTVDKDCDGVPEKGWMPGSDKPKTTALDAGPDKGTGPDAKAAADAKAAPDKTVAVKDSAVKPDQKAAADKAAAADKQPASDQAAATDQGAGKDLVAVKDQATVKDQAMVKDQAAGKDQAIKKDQAVKKDVLSQVDTWTGDASTPPSKNDKGCACSASGDQGLSMGMMMLGLLALAVLPRRRRPG